MIPQKEIVKTFLKGICFKGYLRKSDRESILRIRHMHPLAPTSA
jgi:hypothetical protein